MLPAIQTLCAWIRKTAALDVQDPVDSASVAMLLKHMPGSISAPQHSGQQIVCHRGLPDEDPDFA